MRREKKEKKRKKKRRRKRKRRKGKKEGGDTAAPAEFCGQSENCPLPSLFLLFVWPAHPGAQARRKEKIGRGGGRAAARASWRPGGSLVAALNRHKFGQS